MASGGNSEAVGGWVEVDCASGRGGASSIFSKEMLGPYLIILIFELPCAPQYDLGLAAAFLSTCGVSKKTAEEYVIIRSNY